MHTYPGITPFNVYDIEVEVLNDLIEAAQPKD
jgi:hypothetical protein